MMFWNSNRDFFCIALACLFGFGTPEAISSERFQLPYHETLPMNSVDHPVSTTNPEAQKNFNKGMTAVYSFNYELAFREFKEASLLDPDLAMAYWGMALSLGQNINSDVTAENEIKAYEYSQKALVLLSNASRVEADYIKALAKRYTNDPYQDLVALRSTYRDAMKKVSSDYPYDLDAACLYVESILNIDPWNYWTWDGKPKDGTLEAIDVINSILNRAPNHLGANHYDIHVWEESATPERALLSAFRLTKIFPESGHLLHMPCHIFILCGYYDEAIQTSKNAIVADLDYIRKYGMEGEYPIHYLSHNLNIFVRAYMLSEQYEKAMQTAFELNRFLEPYYQRAPSLLAYQVLPMEVNLYFHRWKEILAYKKPGTDSPTIQAYWHFSRAMAYAHLGDQDSLEKEKGFMLDFLKKMNPDEEISNNSATSLLGLAELLLNASVARLENNHGIYINDLQSAIDELDQFKYDEPPAWFVPIRIELGKAYLLDKRYKEAEGVFRKGLSGLQRNGRFLFGLNLSLRGQGRDWDAYWVEREAHAALKHASQPITFDSL